MMPDEHKPHRPHDEEQPHDIEPVEPEPPAAPDAPKPSLDKPGILHGFDEDADFDRDPEVDRAILGKPPRPPPPTPSTPADRERPPAVGERPVLVERVGGDAKVWGIAGALLLLAALIATGATSPYPGFFPVLLNILLTLYNALLHTGTGVAALYLTAMFLERRMGPIELAAARMLAAVAAFSLIFNLNIHILGETKAEETILAATAYVLVLIASLRLWSITLGYVIATHFVLWLVLQLGNALSAHLATVPQISRPPAAAAPASPPPQELPERAPSRDSKPAPPPAPPEP